MTEAKQQNTRQYITMTAEQSAKWEHDVALIEAEKPEINKWAASAMADQEVLGEAIAAGLQSARQESGLTLADLAERTGIDQCQLSRLLNTGDTDPTVNTLQRIAKSLGRTLVIKFAKR